MNDQQQTPVDEVVQAEEVSAVVALANIRAAVGDTEGRLTNGELVERCRDLCAEVKRLREGVEERAVVGCETCIHRTHNRADSNCYFCCAGSNYKLDKSATSCKNIPPGIRGNGIGGRGEPAADIR